MTYADKLQDHRWLRKRDEVRRRANYQCEDCPCTTGFLHVHHVYYIYGRDPWDYPDYLLKCVCEDCHRRRGQIEQAIFCAVARVLCGMTPEEMMEQPIYTMFDGRGPIEPPDFGGDT